MANLAAETKDLGFQLEQVQGFTPTPMTVATVIYYSGYHPYTLKKVNTPKTRKEKDDQHRFFFWYKDENKAWIKKTLGKLGRDDLLKRLLPEGKDATINWRKNKPGKAKHTFNDAVPFNQRKAKAKFSPKKEEEKTVDLRAKKKFKKKRKR